MLDKWLFWNLFFHFTKMVKIAPYLGLSMGQVRTKRDEEPSKYMIPGKEMVKYFLLRNSI